MNSREWKMRWYEAARRWLVNHARDCVPGNQPRRWSNQELRATGPLFKGDVLNVSGWRDEDKQEGHYRDYFPNAKSYGITNYWGTDSRNDGADGSLFLDLEAPLPDAMRGVCDLAWTHTVLEHVGDVETAFRNLGALTRDAVLVVVPWIQDEHYAPGLYGDYWRFAPMGIQRLMKGAGLELIHLRANEQPWYPVYLFAVGSKKPEQWKGQFPELDWKRRLGRNQYNYPGCIS
jgi:hypothetical protein